MASQVSHLTSSASETGAGTPKRPRDPEESEQEHQESKKLKPLTSSQATRSSALEVSRVRDSAPAQPQAPTLQEPQSDKTSNHDLHAQILRMQLENTNLQSALTDHIAALESIRSTHEANAFENRRLRAQITEVEAAKAKAEAQRDTAVQNSREAKEEAAKLRTKLKELQVLFEGSAVPELAEVGKLRADAAAKEAAERRLASLTADFEFTREEYQKASNMAAELSSDNMAMQAQVEQLKRQASGEAAKLRAMFEVNAAQRSADSAQRYTREIAELRRLCQQQAEEIKVFREKEASKMATRSVSMGPSLSRDRHHAAPPGPSSLGTALRAPRTSSRASSRTTSRQASPMPSGHGGHATPAPVPSSSAPAMGMGARLAAQHALGKSGRH